MRHCKPSCGMAGDIMHQFGTSPVGIPKLGTLRAQPSHFRPILVLFAASVHLHCGEVPSSSVNSSLAPRTRALAASTNRTINNYYNKYLGTGTISKELGTPYPGLL